MDRPRGMRFRKFFTPELAVIIFWLFAVPAFGVAILDLAKGQNVIGLSCLAAILFLRVMMETMAVLFQIHHVLIDIRDNAKEDAGDLERVEREAKLQKARDLAATRENKPASPGESRLNY